MICSFACFDLLGLILYVRVNNLSALSGWVYLGGSSTKQRVKCLFALIFSPQSDRGDFLSFCCIPVSVSCSIGHNTLTLMSVCLELANLQLSHCAPHRNERLRQIVHNNIILLDSLFLINKKATIYMFGFSKETSHLEGSFEYPEEIQMILFSKFANLPHLMIYPIILKSNIKPIKSRLFVNPDARFSFWMQELFSHSLKTRQHLAMHKVGAV